MLARRFDNLAKIGIPPGAFSDQIHPPLKQLLQLAGQPEVVDSLVMVGYGVLVSRTQAPGLAKLFDQVHDVCLRDGIA